MIQSIKNFYHLCQAVVANVIHGFPSKGMIIIGVTGTDGKTTTASTIYQILTQSGEKAALLTTVSAVINGKSYDTGFHVTTPNSFVLQSYIKKAKDVGVNYFVLETTSHGLDQNRVFGIKYAVGVVTNITHEHLDYHKTYENYVAAKAKLLKNSTKVVVNRDDMSYGLLLKIKNETFKIKDSDWITYGMHNSASLNPKVFPFTFPLKGEFNHYNALAAIGALRAIGISDSAIRKGLSSVVPPLGRQDIVYNKDFTIMIDFAHTPNSLEKILSEQRKNTKGRLIHVFGSAGLRDMTKRPLMGRASSLFSDIIVLTSEDPRSESVEEINKGIRSGIQNPKFEVRNPKEIQKNKVQNDSTYIVEIPRREEAISFAIGQAKKGDTIVLTGKSHEKSMNYGNGEEAWDEYKAVHDALQLKTKN